MIEINVFPDDESLQNIVSALDQVGTKSMPNLMRAFRLCSVLIEREWKSYALGASIPGTSMKIKNPTGGYARSIKKTKLSDFHYIIYSDAPYAKWLEDGTSGYDMKQTHPYGARSRMGKDGPYLIIPFQHGARGTISKPQIPGDLYKNILSGIKEGSIQKTFVEKGKKLTANYQGKLIPKGVYNWGTRMKGIGGNLEGMVIMEQSSPNKGRSGFTTFRVISVNSPQGSWIQRARPALRITDHVAQNISPTLKEIIEDGIRRDIGI